jgi:DNA-directed RNA polymerase specialized sigma24 family protein
MTKNSILTEIYLSKEVDVMIRSIKPEHLQDDIKQHCFTELFEKSEEFILDLHNRKKLKNYIIKILYNTSRWARTPFHNQLGRETPTEFIQDCECEQYEEVNIEPVLNKIYWYKVELIRLYAEHGTFQKVSDLTGIPLKSVYTTIIEARKEIKKKYHES